KPGRRTGPIAFPVSSARKSGFLSPGGVENGRKVNSFMLVLRPARGESAKKGRQSTKPTPRP
uniref:hypothetical protein n=1 Tax=Alistipes shahii TaxID=328814 RepID=UPI00307CA8AC